MKLRTLTIRHRTHGLERVVYRRKCDDCGAKWPERTDEVNAIRDSRGHSCSTAGGAA